MVSDMSRLEQLVQGINQRKEVNCYKIQGLRDTWTLKILFF